MTIAAIPTTYKGIYFRSRLEAKWAFVFDQIGWPWEYEPIDLNGYIRSGWDKEALVVGGSLLGRYDAIGIMNCLDWRFYSDGEEGKVWTQNPQDWEEAEVFHCHEHKGIGICHSIQSYKCRVCGAHDGDSHKCGSADTEVRAAFNAATNAAKYRHGKR